ncbi:MAG: efflux RND transporter periplasmic adaptor subunit [Zoogloeaceae bacterium]|jgi:HlyD family secretion protein|nr:efflux RND transporter periplasmic adaptor subunit [Zoogloeaceae bacterium]
MSLLKTLLETSAQPHEKPGFFKRRGKRWGLVLVVFLLPLVWFLRNGNSAGETRYVSEILKEGPIAVSVAATGALQPTRSVDVGSELSGTLESVLVQENDQVRKGQLLAQLDISKLNDAVLKSRAAMQSAEANVAQMEATLLEARANLGRMREVAELSGGKVPAKTEMDAAVAAEKRAEANLKSARASVSQAAATLKTDETNIRKATITSPVDGVVLARKVEPGQTVAASMTTPVLFTIAEDLTKMELDVNVDEADVAQVMAGQTAHFTVAAWANRKFPAKVARVDLGSTLTDNVVTYTTVLEVANDDLALRPGMTASAEIVTAKRDKALLLPNAALRFTPMNANAGGESGFLAKLMPRFPRQGQTPRKRLEKGSAVQVWILENDQPRPVSLEIGVSNGRYTEVLGGDLKAGMVVITEQERAK